MKRIFFALTMLRSLSAAPRQLKAARMFRSTSSITILATTATGSKLATTAIAGNRTSPSAIRNWRPYADGYWAYTDVGWTWVSNEDFGWATYHYGRWARLRDHGWVWVPGREWGPAWVSWRTGGDYVGWAPLPPRRGEVAKSFMKVGQSAVRSTSNSISGLPTTTSSMSATSANRSCVSGFSQPEQNVTYISQHGERDEHHLQQLDRLQLWPGLQSTERVLHAADPASDARNARPMST